MKTKDQGIVEEAKITTIFGKGGRLREEDLKKAPDSVRIYIRMLESTIDLYEKGMKEIA